MRFEEITSRLRTRGDIRLQIEGEIRLQTEGRHSSPNLGCETWDEDTGDRRAGEEHTNNPNNPKKDQRGQVSGERTNERPLFICKWCDMGKQTRCCEIKRMEPTACMDESRESSRNLFFYIYI